MPRRPVRAFQSSMAPRVVVTAISGLEGVAATLLGDPASMSVPAVSFWRRSKRVNFRQSG